MLHQKEEKGEDHQVVYGEKKYLWQCKKEDWKTGIGETFLTFDLK